jgi:SNF2 family DNA or RNA helicase
VESRSRKQAINRAHRIGQDKHVMVYRFITQNTLEEKILKLQERKTELADVFVNENAFKHITEEEIMELFE